mmetsp:Transcript_41465/g.121278  ORF Transcript_41465/g.121278 Transcript_41465/m.121278 type:complete len:210 (-) Transcript_41465:1086-1715(-)
MSLAFTVACEGSTPSNQYALWNNVSNGCIDVPKYCPFRAAKRKPLHCQFFRSAQSTSWYASCNEARLWPASRMLRESAYSPRITASALDSCCSNTVDRWRTCKPMASVAVAKPSTFGPSQCGSSLTHASDGARHVIEVPTRRTTAVDCGGRVPSVSVKAWLQCQPRGIHRGRNGPRTPSFKKMKCVRFSLVVGWSALMPSVRSRAPCAP